MVILYAGFIPFDAHLSPNDDHGFVVTTLLGKPLQFDIDPSNGRFDPLTGQEFNLVALISNNPFSYFTFNAIELLLFAGLFMDVMRGFVEKKLALLALATLLLLPGFASAWFNLQVSERDSLALFAAFLWSYWRFANGNARTHALLAILSANLALYYKETSFIMLGSFALTRLAATEPRGNRTTSKLDILLLLSAMLFAVLYYVLIYRHRGPVLYGTLPVNPLLRAAKNVTLYITTDPILAFLVLPLTAWRFRMILTKRSPLDAVGDPMLAAAATYMSAYLILNIAKDYYWLPAYVFAMPALFHWAAQPEAAKARAWAVGVGLTVVFLVTGAIPATLANITYYKYDPHNYDAMVNFLAANIGTSATGRTNIYIDGLGPDSELYVSLARFLVHAGLPADRFDLRSELPADYPDQLEKGAGKVAHAFSAFQGAPPSHPGSGDYLIVPPYGDKRLDAGHPSRLETEYSLVFQTSSPLGIPDLSLRALLKRLARRLVPEMVSGGDVELSADLDYAVFIKR